MRNLSNSLVAITLAAAMSITSIATADITIDFESFANGQSVEGETIGLATITSSGANLGAAIYDSDPPTGADPDLEFSLGTLGNILILQSTDSPSMTGDIFNTPNDEADGGFLYFDFASAVRMLSLDLVDIDDNGPARVTLYDSSGDRRRWYAPSQWTGDSDWETLDLTTLADQAGPGSGGDATVTINDAGFDPDDVVRMVVKFYGSAGLDNVTYDDLEVIPAPGAALLAMMGFGTVGWVRRRIV